MEFVIEKDIPLRGKETFRKPGVQKKIAEMASGDSVRLERNQVGYVRNCIYKIGLKEAYTIRKQDDGSYRMWRL
ncbi:hypothetical protein ACUTR7_00325 [Delftia sp. NA_296.1]|uniref:hypothetical protein n=1 Tax=Delftia sp. NA_296.1 TaxID=3415648 RepID=UPI00404639D4